MVVIVRYGDEEVEEARKRARERVFLLSCRARIIMVVVVLQTLLSAFCGEVKIEHASSFCFRWGCGLNFSGFYSGDW